MSRLEELDRLPPDLPPATLARWLSPRQVSLDPGFVAAYLAAPPEGVEPRLLVARDEAGTIRAVLPLARFTVALDCLAPPWVQAAAGRVRALVPGFLRVRLLMFGWPAGLGTLDLAVPVGDAPAALAEAAGLAGRHGLELLARERATALVLKEFGPADRAAAAALAPLAPAYPSVPVVVQDLAVGDDDAYLASLRAGYRRQLLAHRAAARKAGLALVLDRDPGPWIPAWYPLFRAVLARSETRLETLPEGFFAALASDPRCRMNLALEGDALVGGALCLVDGPTLHFLFVGFDYAVNETARVYFNLLDSVLGLAFAKGCRHVRWGQTSLDAKGRFGGRAEPLAFHLRFRNRLLDALVRLAAPLLFPERPQLPRQVFKNDPAPGRSPSGPTASRPG